MAFTAQSSRVSVSLTGYSLETTNYPIVDITHSDGCKKGTIVFEIIKCKEM